MREVAVWCILPRQLVGIAQKDPVRIDSASMPGLNLEAYPDVYFASDGNEPTGSDIPYLVPNGRQNEIHVNLACITARCAADRVRGMFTPGFGSYLNANRATEEATLQNPVEANIGVRVSTCKDIWLDVSVLSYGIGQHGLARACNQRYACYGQPVAGVRYRETLPEKRACVLCTGRTLQ